MRTGSGIANLIIATPDELKEARRRCASAGVYGSKIAGVSAGGLRQDFAGAKLLLFTVSAVFAEVAKSRKDLIGSRGSPFVTSWTS
jgi:hypothetical protein